MKTALATLVGLVVFAALLAAALYVYGTMQPEEHRASLTTELSAPREKVWALITDYDHIPEWWDAETASTTASEPDGRVVTRTSDRHGQVIAFYTSDQVPNEKLVRKIIDKGLPFGGTWTYELKDSSAGGTVMTISEDGFVHPPFYRAIMKLFIGADANMKSFATALSTKLTREKH